MAHSDATALSTTDSFGELPVIWGQIDRTESVPGHDVETCALSHDMCRQLGERLQLLLPQSHFHRSSGFFRLVRLRGAGIATTVSP
jgi:hypothetical protein